MTKRAAWCSAAWPSCGCCGCSCGGASVDERPGHHINLPVPHGRTDAGGPVLRRRPRLRPSPGGPTPGGSAAGWTSATAPRSTCPSGDGRPTPTSTWRFVVDDFDAVHRRAVAAGAEWTSRGEGGRCCGTRPATSSSCSPPTPSRRDGVDRRPGRGRGPAGPGGQGRLRGRRAPRRRVAARHPQRTPARRRQPPMPTRHRLLGEPERTGSAGSRGPAGSTRPSPTSASTPSPRPTGASRRRAGRRHALGVGRRPAQRRRRRHSASAQRLHRPHGTGLLAGGDDPDGRRVEEHRDGCPLSAWPPSTAAPT